MSSGGRAGIAADEVDALLAGRSRRRPLPGAWRCGTPSSGQRPAATTDPDSRAELALLYGERTAEAVDSTLLGIRIGNPVGNTLDRWVCRVLPWCARSDARRPAAGAGESRS